MNKNRKNMMLAFALVIVLVGLFVFVNVSYNKKYNAKVDNLNTIIENKISIDKEYKIVEPALLYDFEILLDSVLFLEDESNENYIIDKSYFTFTMEESVANKILNKEYLYGCYIKFNYSNEGGGIVMAHIYEK